MENPTPAVRSALRLRFVEADRRANQVLQRLFIDVVALLEVDGAPRIAVEAGVEEIRRIVHGGTFEEGELDDLLVRLAGADDPVVLPDGNPSPLPLFDHLRIGL